SVRTLSGKVAGWRPAYLPPDPASRTAYAAGEIAQHEFWFPDVAVPVRFGQGRPAIQLPVLTMGCGDSRWASALLGPSGGGLGQRPAEYIGGRPRTGAIRALALGGEQRSPGPGVVGAELAPHVLDEPPQATVRAVDQRHQPRLGPAPPRALAVADAQL